MCMNTATSIAIPTITQPPTVIPVIVIKDSLISCLMRTIHSRRMSSNRRTSAAPHTPRASH